jgi:hypothetical protein
MNEQVIWITTPPVNASQHEVLKELLLITNTLVLSKIQQYDFEILNIYEELQNYLVLRAKDGVHWMPEGHRVITQFLIKCIKQLINKNKSISIDNQELLADSVDNSENISASKFYFLQYFSSAMYTFMSRSVWCTT